MRGGARPARQTAGDNRGVVEGVITTEPRGANGFGYDPVFTVPEFGCTCAELEPDKKDSISHRGRAFRAMKEKLGELFPQL